MMLHIENQIPAINPGTTVIKDFISFYLYFLIILGIIIIKKYNII